MTEKLKIDRNLIEMLSKRKTDIKEHLWTLFNLVQELNAKTVVELGAGQSTFVLCAAVNESGGVLYSIDIDPSAYQRGFPEGRNLLEGQARYKFIAGNDMEVVRTWEKWIDLLFIDPMHLDEHTKMELEQWSKFVRPGGKIAMHDTFHTKDHAVDCRKALDDFLKENPGIFSVVHIESGGGLSILTKLE